MDTITQGLVGALCTQAVAGKKVPKSLFLLGFVAGNFADLDVLIRNSNPLTQIVYHRQFTHSLLFSPLGALLVTLIFLSIFTKLRPHFLLIGLASFLAYLSHIFLDVCTSYGTEIFWPFSDERVALGFLPIVDPVFTITALIGAIFAYRCRAIYSWMLPLVFLGLYITFGSVQHNRVVEALKKSVSVDQSKVKKFNAIPMVGQLYIWHGFYQKNNKIYSYIVNVPYLGAAYLTKKRVYSRYIKLELPGWVKSDKKLMAAYHTFSRFSDHYLVAISQKPLIIANARYIRSINPSVFIWSLRFSKNQRKKQVDLLWHQSF